MAIKISELPPTTGADIVSESPLFEVAAGGSSYSIPPSEILASAGVSPGVIDYLESPATAAGPGASIFGDSIGAATGATSTGVGNRDFTNGYAYRLQPVIGGPYRNFSRSGDQTADQSWLTIMASTNPLGSGVDPLAIHELGTNDVTRYASDANRQNITKRVVLNSLAWLAIPATNKRLGQAATLTGFIADDTLQKGLGVTSSTTGNTASFAITTLAANSAVYIGYRITDGNTGTFTVSVDGVPQTDPYSGSTTWVCAGDASTLISTQNGTVNAVAGARLAIATAGAHTVVVTVTSSGQPVTVYWVGAVPTASTLNPTVVAVSPNHQNNANDALSGTYAGFISTAVSTLAADGLNVIYADTRTALGTAYGTYYTDAIHPNNAGHALMDTTIQAVIPDALKIGAINNGYQPRTDFVANAPLTPAFYASPNPYNLSSSTDFNPGILLGSQSNQVSYIAYQGIGGINIVQPNVGAPVGIVIGAYPTTGRGPATPAVVVPHISLAGNGQVSFFNTTLTGGTNTTMTVQSNVVRMGGSTGPGTAFSSAFANNYILTNTAATSGANVNSPNFYWRGSAWNGSASASEDIGFRVEVAAGSNPASLLTLVHSNGTTGTWGFSLAGATGALVLSKTITAAGTTATQTINKMSGIVNIAAGLDTVTVNNTLCVAPTSGAIGSIVTAIVATNDATAMVKNVVAGAGSFVINLIEPATAETRIAFRLTN